MATTHFPTQSPPLSLSAALPPSDRLGQSGLTSLPPGGVGSASAATRPVDAGTTPSTLVSAATGHPPQGAVPVAGQDGAKGESTFLQLSPSCARMPVGLVVSVPVREFRVRNLLAMAPGAVIETQWGYGEDLPLSSGDVQLAWTEFEVVDTKLAVRVTRLA